MCPALLLKSALKSSLESILTEDSTLKLPPLEKPGWVLIYIKMRFGLNSTILKCTELFTFLRIHSQKKYIIPEAINSSWICQIN